MGILGRLFGKRKNIEDMQWQVSVVQNIGISMIQQIPEDWASAVLILEPENGLGKGLKHSAITPKRGVDFQLQNDKFVMPNMETLAATREFELAWVARTQEFAQALIFKRAIISVAKDGEDWVVKNDYEYD